MVEIGFFPLDIDYKDKKFNTEIRLFGKADDGKRVCVIDRNFYPYFWVIAEDIKNIRQKIELIKDEDFEVVKTEMDTKKYKNKSVEVLKVFVDFPKSVRKIREIIEDNLDAKTIESDILFVRRYLIDKEIYPNRRVVVKGKIIPEKMNVDYCIEAEQVYPKEKSFEDKKSLAFDIETYTDPNSWSSEEKDPIMSIAFWGDDFRKAVTWKKFGKNKNIVFVNSEAELIEEAKKTIKDYNPDYLVGYFSDGFDFHYLHSRAKKYNINLNLGLDGSNVKLNRKGMKSAKITGMVHIDIFKFIKNIMGGSLQLDNYSLSEVGKSLVNSEKKELDFNKIHELWKNKEGVEEICEYNLKDAEITYNIFRAVLNNLEELVKIIGVPIYDVCRMSYGQLVEWYLIRKAKEAGILVPNKPRGKEVGFRKRQTYQGAFVFTPKPGLYENLAVVDFKSLYPSIISAKNIDPSTLTNSKKDSYESPEINGVRYYFSYKEEGFLPTVIKDLLIRRGRIKEIIKKEGKNKILEARSYGLKTVLNSAYGYTGYFNARFYCNECASSITAWGRHYIREISERAEKCGLNPIYGDTDSLVLTLKEKGEEEVINFLKEVNYALPSLMELELEDFYPRGIFVMKKSSTAGAKKKYALVNKSKKMVIKGFETIRRDWSYLAKEVQKNVLEKVLIEGNQDEAFKYVRKIINDVRLKNIPLEKMVIRSRLRKDVSSYEQISPRVVVAERMKNKGMKIGAGSNIKYVVAEGSGLVRDRARIPSECEDKGYDSEYYVEKQVLPAVKMIFESIGYKEEEIREDHRQKNLGDF